MFAIIDIRGRQYLAVKGQRINLDRIDHNQGTVTFGRVLAVHDGQQLQIGQPTVAGALVRAKVIRDFRDRKIRVIKYKPKVRYRRSIGHRQAKTQVEITDIS